MECAHALSIMPIDWESNHLYLFLSSWLCSWVDKSRVYFPVDPISASGFHIHCDVNQCSQEVSLAIFTEKTPFSPLFLRLMPTSTEHHAWLWHPDIPSFRETRYFPVFSFLFLIVVLLMICWTGALFWRVANVYLAFETWECCPLIGG